MIFLIFLLGITSSDAFHNINIGKCKKKLDVGLYYCNLKIKPFKDEFYVTAKKLKAYNKLVSIKKEKILNDSDTKNAVVHGLLDSSSDDIFYQFAEVLSLVTDTNKEALVLFQTFLKEYFKYNLYEKLNKDFEISVDTRNIIVILFRNIIIPTIIHDLFQTILKLINHK
jgi:hypothetical protein